MSLSAATFAPDRASAQYGPVDPFESAVRVLRDGVQSRNDGLQHAAMVALRELRDPATRPLLERLLRSDDWSLRVDSVLGLAEIDPASDAVKRGAAWLLAHQNEDGGWGGAKGITPSTIEETALALRSAVESAERRADRAEDRAERCDRKAFRAMNVAAVLLAALSVSVAYTVFTSRQLATVADTVDAERERAEALKAALEVAKADSEARDTARQLADARALEAEDRAQRFEAVVGVLAGECPTPPDMVGRSRP